MRRFVSLICFILLAGGSSCGYHFHANPAPSARKTVSVTYVNGDQAGAFTDALIHAIAASPHYIYCREGGQVELCVTILSNNSEKIGYRYDRKGKEGKRQQNLVPTEGRQTIVAQVTIKDACTEKILVGPCNVKVSAPYDYVDYNSINDLSFVNSKGERQSSIAFSLGQLDSIEGAQTDVLTVLYRRLSEKIVDGLERSCF